MYRGGRTKYFESCGLEFVKSVGQISRSEVEKYWENAHLHIITSALEANTTVLFEAMEHCIPTLTTDICGMADIVKNNTGIKIAVDSYDKICIKIAETIDKFAENPNELINLALNLREDSFNYTCTEREKFYNNLYEELVN